MESTSVSKLEQVVLTMDLREAQHFLEDPERAQEHVRGILQGHGVVVAEGNGRPRKGKKASSLTCDRCSKECASESGLKHHVTVMHPETLKG